jgi:hypothetical protein
MQEGVGWFKGAGAEVYLREAYQSGRFVRIRPLIGGWRVGGWRFALANAVGADARARSLRLSWGRRSGSCETRQRLRWRLLRRSRVPAGSGQRQRDAFRQEHPTMVSTVGPLLRRHKRLAAARPLRALGSPPESSPRHLARRLASDRGQGAKPPLARNARWPLAGTTKNEFPTAHVFSAHLRAGGRGGLWEVRQPG